MVSNVSGAKLLNSSRPKGAVRLRKRLVERQAVVSATVRERGDGAANAPPFFQDCNRNNEDFVKGGSFRVRECGLRECGRWRSV